MECEESILGLLVRDVLEKLASNDWDYIAPFALLNQLWLYRPMKENLDLVKAQMLEKLVACCWNGVSTEVILCICCLHRLQWLGVATLLQN